tara:strand:+ start:577 stop:891 length:315 start_codon:yes stop_codon:yes gene_type:complete
MPHLEQIARDTFSWLSDFYDKHTQEEQYLQKSLLKNLGCLEQQVIENAGWHFTYILSNEQILAKIRHYADTEEGAETEITDYEAHRRTSPAWNADFRVFPVDGV